MSGDDPLERTFDTADTGLRNGIELATATHGLSSDENSALGGALEDHYKNIKTRNDRELKGELPPDGIRRQDRLRYSIRAAVQSAKQKAANPERQKTNGYEVPPGAPQLWSKDAKAEFDQAPHSVKMAALREQKAFVEAIEPIVERYKAFEQAIGPFRANIPQGMADHQAVKRCSSGSMP